MARAGEEADEAVIEGVSVAMRDIEWKWRWAGMEGGRRTF